MYRNTPKEISLLWHTFNIYLNVHQIHQFHLYILRFFFRLMMLKENIVTVTNSNDFCAPQLILCPMMMLVMISQRYISLLLNYSTCMYVKGRSVMYLIHCYSRNRKINLTDVSRILLCQFFFQKLPKKWLSLNE